MRRTVRRALTKPFGCLCCYGAKKMFGLWFGLLSGRSWTVWFTLQKEMKGQVGWNWNSSTMTFSIPGQQEDVENSKLQCKSNAQLGSTTDEFAVSPSQVSFYILYLHDPIFTLWSPSIASALMFKTECFHSRGPSVILFRTVSSAARSAHFRGLYFAHCFSPLQLMSHNHLTYHQIAPVDVDIHHHTIQRPSPGAVCKPVAPRPQLHLPVLFACHKDISVTLVFWTLLT